MNASAGGLGISCGRFVLAGGQQRTPGRLTARLAARDGAILCDVDAEMDRPDQSASRSIVRGVPRGRLSAGGAPFFDPRDDEVLLGYPFSGGDLFGPQGNGGLTTPLVLVQRADGADQSRSRRSTIACAPSGSISSRAKPAIASKRCRSRRLAGHAIVPGAGLAHRARPRSRRGRGGAALRRTSSARSAMPRWDTRADVPDWMRRTSLVVTLHGMHYTGYMFNDYAQMLEILRWMATQIPGRARARVPRRRGTAATTGTIPLYAPSDRMGGEAGFRALIAGADRRSASR